MKAVFYDRQGPASEVLKVGVLPDPEPQPGEVRVRLVYSGVNPGDTKKRQGWLGSSMPHPRVVPHSDGAGVVDAVGPGVDPAWVGERVWVFNAQSYRPFGTAAHYTCVPVEAAIPLPDSVDEQVGACLGIPGITAHRAVFADGPVADRTVLVQGVLGAVGSMAAQLALAHGARVIGTVRRADDLHELPDRLRGLTVSLDSNPEERIMRLAPEGVDRVVEVAFGDNVDLDAAVLRNGGVLAAYATRQDRPDLPFWPMLFDNVVIRLLGSDDFPQEARQDAARDLTDAAANGELDIPIDEPLPLEECAKAHDKVDAGSRKRVVLDVA